MPERLAPLATDIDPVFRGDLHETDNIIDTDIVDSFGLVSLKRTQKGPPQTKSRSRYRVYAVTHEIRSQARS
jgi:hypothetical protein